MRSLQLGCLGDGFLRAGLAGEDAQPAAAGCRQGIEKRRPVSREHPLDHAQPARELLFRHLGLGNPIM
jgi:hypothetical protein